MSELLLIADSKNPLAISLLPALRQAANGTPHTFDLRKPGDGVGSEAVSFYLPALDDRNGFTPDLHEAQCVFASLAQSRPLKFILLSSALIYGTGPARQSMVDEDYPAGERNQPSVCGPWHSLEVLARQSIPERSLVILRPPVLLHSANLIGRRLLHRLAITLPGRDPMVQILSLSDLARAVVSAIAGDQFGTFNIAPDGAIPLRAAIRAAGNHPLPLPAILQFQRREDLDFLRYPSTVSNHKMKEQLGAAPARSSVAALMEVRLSGGNNLVREQDFDEFGMDEAFIRSCGKTLFKALCDFYWRVDAQGTEHLPRAGRAVLVGTHRGFMPWDGIMALCLVVRETGRIPRFLTHPGLFRFPFMAPLMARLGGVVACQESADRILEAGGLLGIYPEGVQGAFSLHRTAYKIQPSWRNTFVRVALRHSAPLIPFVNVGSADSLPVFAQIKSRAWARFADWPCIPISTFPFVPLPLPTKWHVRFLPPIPLDHYPPNSADDPALVKTIGAGVRRTMQDALDTIVRQRRSVFF